MILIADGGSTKTNWCFLKEKGERLFVDTEGYNPYFVNSDYIKKSLHLGFDDQINKEDVSEVYFYGSGCFSETAGIVGGAIEQVFKHAKVSIELDLLAAARALLGSSPGFAAILGTGTNTCLYDGEKIIKNIDSLGFILGDEGSGTAMGKRLLGDYIRGYMSTEVEALFWKEFELTKEQIFQQVYSNSLANRFCSSFARFIHQHIYIPYIADLVESCFKLFFENLVSGYTSYREYAFNCIGSIGDVFADQIKKVAADFGMQTGVIIKSPLDGLIAYHSTARK